MDIDYGFWTAECLKNGDMKGYDYWMEKYFEVVRNAYKEG